MTYKIYEYEICGRYGTPLFVGLWLKEIPGTVKQEYANGKHFLSYHELLQRKQDN